MNEALSESARPYARPVSNTKLSPQQKSQLLVEHLGHYARLAAENPGALNVKVPRAAFQELLAQIGSFLQSQASQLASQPGPVADFLAKNPLPPSMSDRLSPDFRVFCLALNALKQWVAAEQAATDRYLLGGTARAQCRAVAKTCLVTGQKLQSLEIELHHPVRDGRPPIPLSKRGHAMVESQNSTFKPQNYQHAVAMQSSAHSAAANAGIDQMPATLSVLKHRGHFSWIMLRRGCLDLLGRPTNHSTPQVGASSRTFARKAIKATGLAAEQLLVWLDASGLVRE